MAYIKTDWADGDVISEAGLDHLENGVYNNSVAIGDLTDLDTTDKTNLVAAINEAAQSGGGGGSLSNAVKDALLQIAAKVAYIDADGQDYYDDLYDALYPGATIVSINADYTQTGTVYPTASLDDLRNDLVVNAIYDNGSVVPVISYTLSGTLEEGTSTITVTYEGLTDTFDVEVTAAPTLSSIAAVYTQSGTVYDTDSLDSLKSDLVVTATYSDSSTATVPSADYTLSGTLTVGTSTITVTYSEKTTTFSVTVSGSALPSEYEKVDFITRPPWAGVSDYINTGVTLSGTGTAVFDLTYMLCQINDANVKYIVDIRENATGSNTVGYGVALSADGNSVYSFAGGSTASIDVTGGALEKKMTVTATVNSSGWTISDGDASNSVTATPRVYAGTPICLFGQQSYAGQVQNTFYGRIYSLKVTEDSVEKLDLVPCKRVADGVAGFYDMVNEAFYTGTNLLAGTTTGKTDTTAEIIKPGYVLAHKSNDPQYFDYSETNGGITEIYDMDAASTTLYPAGIIATSGNVLRNAPAALYILDDNETPINFVSEASTSSFNRWVKEIGASMTEYSQSWAVAEYTKIQFSVDVRYLDYSYMYDVPSGKIFFAGVHTPYYGMTNISQASA